LCSFKLIKKADFGDDFYGFWRGKLKKFATDDFWCKTAYILAGFNSFSPTKTSPSFVLSHPAPFSTNELDTSQSCSKKTYKIQWFCGRSELSIPAQLSTTRPPRRKENRNETANKKFEANSGRISKRDSPQMALSYLEITKPYSLTP
jgi:hypothetical protein